MKLALLAAFVATAITMAMLSPSTHCATLRADGTYDQRGCE